MERIWPVFTSMTTAVPLTELEVSIALANDCSDSYCSWESSVSSRPVPGLEATCCVTGDWGRVTPPGDSMYVALPGVPARRELSPNSRPPAPLPAAFVNPTTGVARFPFGTTLLESAISEMPGKASAEIFCPVAWGSWRATTTYPVGRCNSAARVVAGTWMMGDSARAVCTGCAIWKSSATTSSVGTETASGDPSRS